MAKEGYFKPSGQTQSLESVPSQLPHLSSFNISKMVQTAKLNYTLEEAMGSPKAMLEILDSLPDETEELQASGGGIDEDGSKSSLFARQELKADMRQTLIVLDDIMRKMAEMSGHPVPDTVKPLKAASQSTVEKLPPITNQYLTTAPLEWGSEKKSISSVSDGNMSPKKERVDEVVKNGVVVAISKKCSSGLVATAEKEAAEIAATEKVFTKNASSEKEATEKVATEKENAAAEKEAAEKKAAKKAARKATIQAKIAELERVMQEEMQKLKQIDEEPDTAPVESEAEKLKKEAEYEQKMAEYDRIVENAKEHRIAQIEEAMKEQQEALKAAEMERAQQERIKAKIAKEKQAKLEASYKAEMLRKKRAEYDQRMAEFDRIVENAKEQRIAQVEAAIKEKQEAIRIAELEKEKKLAKATMESMSEAEKVMRKRAEYDKKMAEFDRIVESAKEHRIAQIEVATMKEKQEALKTAELERAQREKELVKEKQAKMVADSKAEKVRRKRAEYDRKMAEFNRMIANSKEQRAAQVESQEAQMIAELKRAQEEKVKAKSSQKKQTKVEADDVAWGMNDELEAKLAKELREEMEAKLAMDKQKQVEAKLAQEKQGQEEERLAKERAYKAKKQTQIVEYEHIINAATDHRIKMVEEAKQVRLIELELAKKAEEEAKQEQAEIEAKQAEKKQAQMAEYDRIINTMTDYRIKMVEKAKRGKQEARLAAMGETERAAEIARLESMVSSKVDKAEKAARLAKEKQTEEEAKLATKAEKKAQMAEYDRVINTVTDYRIEMVEKAKREKQEARLAAMNAVEQAEEKARLASMMPPNAEAKAEEPEMKQSGDEVTEGDSEQAADKLEEEEEEISEQEDDGDDDIAELQKSYVQPTRSRLRPPTPPASHPPVHHSHTTLFGPQVSLRTINEGSGACDFTPEFASPLTTHSMHAVVPYMSLRTRLGLRQTEMMSNKELGEEMRRLSEATLVIKKEMMKRKLSSEQAADVSQSCSTA